MQPIYKGQVKQLSPAVVSGQVYGANGQPITQVSTSTILTEVFDVETEERTYHGTPAVADCVYDSMQSPADLRWNNEDAIGWNLSATIPGSAFPEGYRRYQIQVTTTPVSGDDPSIDLWEVETIPVYTSGS